MKQLAIVGLLAVAALVVGGCASSRGGDVYTRDQARQAHEVKMGTVVDLRPVKIEGTEGTVGTLAGAAIGGVGASAIGQGRGSAIAAIAGAVIGGLAGAAAEEGITQRAGWEITVNLDSGSTIAVVQEADDNMAFQLGTRVRVLTDYNGVSRVSPLAYRPPQAPQAQPYPAPANSGQTYPVPR